MPSELLEEDCCSDLDGPGHSSVLIVDQAPPLRGLLSKGARHTSGRRCLRRRRRGCAARRRRRRPLDSRGVRVRALPPGRPPRPSTISVTPAIYGSTHHREGRSPASWEARTDRPGERLTIARHRGQSPYSPSRPMDGRPREHSPVSRCVSSARGRWETSRQAIRCSARSCSTTAGSRTDMRVADVPMR